MALLFTIVVMFSLQGEKIIEQPLDVVIIAVPLLIYFLVMFLVSFFMGRVVGARLRQDGHASLHGRQQQFRVGHCRGGGRVRVQLGGCLAAVIGPLVEVPVMIGLVNVSLYFKRRYFA